MSELLHEIKFESQESWVTYKTVEKIGNMWIWKSWKSCFSKMSRFSTSPIFSLFLFSSLQQYIISNNNHYHHATKHTYNRKKQKIEICSGQKKQCPSSHSALDFSFCVVQTCSAAGRGHAEGKHIQITNHPLFGSPSVFCWRIPHQSLGICWKCWYTAQKKLSTRKIQQVCCSR